MSPNYIVFPQRPPELRAEVGRLLEIDDSRTGEVYRTSLDETQDRKGTKTQATNETHYMLPALLDGRIPAAVEPRKMVASRLRSWIRNERRPLSPALKADLKVQLEAIEMLDPTAQAPASKRRYELPDNTDRVVLARARKEQDRLRDYLLRGRTDAPCDICGRILPTELLVAAHIVPRGDLDHEERMQFDRIAMIACQLGCDRLFELGFLTVNDEGIVEVRPVEGEPAPTLEGLAGRPCSAYNTDTSPAFAAHRSARLPSG